MLGEATVVRAKDSQSDLIGRKLDYRPAIIAVLSVVLVAVASSLGAPAHALVYLALAAVALLGPKAAIQALALSWLATFLNPGIFSKSEAAEILRWLVIASAFISVALRSVRLSMRLTAPIIGVTLFSLVAGLLAPFASYAPDVSIVKIFSFFMVAITVLVGFHMTRDDVHFWRIWFLSFTGVIIVVGFPLVVSDLGFTRNARGFQGLLNHPQVYGSFLAPVLAYLLYSKREGKFPNALWWLIVLFGLTSLFLSQARTGAVALVVGLTAAGTWWFLDRARRGDFRVRGWTVAALLSAVLVLLPTGFILSEGLQASVERFVFKGSTATNLGDAFDASRGFLVERSLQNFYSSPIGGIGFGLPSDPGALRVSRMPMVGIPLGAPVEKGFTVAAVLEEVGMIGFAFFLILLVLVLRPAFRSTTGPAAAALAASAVAVTIGEHVLFAVGGNGLMTWIFLGLAGVLGYERRKIT